LIAGASYYLFSKDNTSSYTFPDMRHEEREALTGSLSAAVDGIKAVIPKIIGSAAQKGEEAAAKLENKLKESTFEFLKNSLNTKLENFGESLGVDIHGVPPKTEEASPVIFAIPADTPAYFSIKNRELQSASYEIDWRDGEKDKGNLGVGKELVVSHSWKRGGDYEIKFKITSGDKVKDYQIVLSIF